MILRDTNIGRALKHKQRGFLLNPARFGAAAPVYLLDTFSGGVAAYSVARQLRTAATLSMRVRRSSDATFADIGFSGGEIDIAALTTFVGANTATVESVLNQGTGAAATLNNGTSANRPTLINAGTLQTLGTHTKPAMTFDSTDFLNTSADSPNFGTTFSLNGNAAYSVFIVHKKTTIANGFLFGWGDTTAALGATGFYDDNTGNTGMQFAGGNPYLSSAVANNTHFLTSVHKSAGAINSTTSIFRNGVSVGTATGSTASSPNVSGNFPLAWGRWGNFTGQFIGGMQELIIFSGNQSANRVAIENDINNFYGIY